MNRFAASAIAVVGVLAGVAGIHAAGRILAAQQDAIAAATSIELDADTEELALRAAEGESGEETAEPDQADEAETSGEPPAGDDLQRVAPRAPLSDNGRRPEPGLLDTKRGNRCGCSIRSRFLPA